MTFPTTFPTTILSAETQRRIAATEAFRRRTDEACKVAAELYEAARSLGGHGLTSTAAGPIVRDAADRLRHAAVDHYDAESVAAWHEMLAAAQPHPDPLDAVREFVDDIATGAEP